MTCRSAFAVTLTPLVTGDADRTEGAVPAPDIAVPLGRADLLTAPVRRGERGCAPPRRVSARPGCRAGARGPERRPDAR